MNDDDPSRSSGAPMEGSRVRAEVCCMRAESRPVPVEVASAQMRQ